MADSETPEKYLCSPEGLLRQVLSFPNVSSRIQFCSYEEFLVFRPVGVSTLLTVIDTHENGLVSLFLLRCYNQACLENMNKPTLSLFLLDTRCFKEEDNTSDW